MRLCTLTALALALAAGLAACGSPGGGAQPPRDTAPAVSPGPGSSAAAQPLPPVPAHTVVVIMENHSYGQVIGSPQAPYLNRLARQGALLTRSYAITHPSEPNYLALLSGSTQGITDDSCPHLFSAANLASELLAAGRTFAGYSEDLPAPGSATCSSGEYARKHVPWADFVNVPAADSLPFSRFPAGDYARLPALSFVIPNLCHDMHDCPVATGDAWLRAHLSGYAQWAAHHASLLVVTWDENDNSPGNQIPTIITGQLVRPARYRAPVTHYGLLRTLEALYRLPPTGHAASAHVITGIWK
jgi:phosphatidylinositol-3-phosphatase